jgi:hypothetical protein
MFIDNLDIHWGGTRAQIDFLFRFVRAFRGSPVDAVLASPI